MEALRFKVLASTTHMNIENIDLHVLIIGKFLHPKCFFCDLCGKQCRTTNFKIENGKYRCVDCNNRNVGEPDSLDSVGML